MLVKTWNIPLFDELVFQVLPFDNILLAPTYSDSATKKEPKLKKKKVAAKTKIDKLVHKMTQVMK